MQEAHKILDSMVDFLYIEIQAGNIDYHLAKRVMDTLIDSLIQAGFDVDDELENFQDVPWVVEAFMNNGIEPEEDE